MAKKFQIRDETFGLALYEAESAREALLDFVADNARGEARPDVVTRDDGSAELVYAGVRYLAVPADAEVADRAEAWAGRYVNESDADPIDDFKRGWPLLREKWRGEKGLPDDYVPSPSLNALRAYRAGDREAAMRYSREGWREVETSDT